LHVSPEILNCADFGLRPEKLAVSGLFGLVEGEPGRTIARDELALCVGDALSKG
jgi:hypothetical protein